MRTSHQQIILSTATFGGSSILNVVIAAVRSKVVALLLGASGVAVVGVLGTMLQTASTVAGMGLRTSGVRELAASQGDPRTLARVRRALWTAHVGLGVIGALVFWAFSAHISTLLFGTADRRTDVACVGAGILLSLIASAQSALLQGLRRIGDLARASSIATGLGAALSLLAIRTWGADAIWLYVLCTPAMSALATRLFVMRLPKADAVRPAAGELGTAWKAMFVLGGAFMITSSMPGIAKLLVQARIGHALGLEPSGHYQAAWSISMQYLGFALTAMAADYYPRLTQGITDRNETRQFVNDQAHIGMLLAGPLVVAMAATAPHLLPLFYARDFAAAAGLLQWQALGDVLKIAGWPIGFVLLAGAETRLFLFTQTTWAVLYAGVSLLLLPRFGIESTGVAFAIACAVGFALNCMLVGARYGFRFSRSNALHLAALLGACLAIVVTARIDARVSFYLGCSLAAATAVHSAHRLSGYLFPEGVRNGLSTFLKRFPKR
jgi:PST family polysaccharide transporter